jgi:putative endonuclease
MAGESLAAQHLRGEGYTIIATGWRCGLGEIDIIAWQGADLVFVEVRSRYNAEPGAELESIGKRKQTQLIRLAQTYMNDHHLDNVPWRIDVVAVTFTRHHPAVVEIINNAVGW